MFWVFCVTESLELLIYVCKCSEYSVLLESLESLMIYVCECFEYFVLFESSESSVIYVYECSEYSVLLNCLNHLDHWDHWFLILWLILKIISDSENLHAWFSKIQKNTRIYTRKFANYKEYEMKELNMNIKYYYKLSENLFHHSFINNMIIFTIIFNSFLILNSCFLILIYIF